MRKADLEKKASTPATNSLNSQADMQAADRLVSACTLIADCGEPSVYNMTAAEVTARISDHAASMAAKHNALLDKDSSDEETMPSRPLTATGSHGKRPANIDDVLPSAKTGFKVPAARNKAKTEDGHDEEIEFKWKKARDDERKPQEDISEKKRRPEEILPEDKKEKIFQVLDLQAQEEQRRESRKLEEVGSSRAGVQAAAGNDEEEDEDDNIF